MPHHHHLDSTSTARSHLVQRRFARESIVLVLQGMAPPHPGPEDDVVVVVRSEDQDVVEGGEGEGGREEVALH